LLGSRNGDIGYTNGAKPNNHDEMNVLSKIYIAGHAGLVGSAIVRKLKMRGYKNLIYQASAQLDLRNQRAVNDFFDQQKPEYVFLAAAKVGGIQANISYRSAFIYDNLQIQTNVIQAAYLSRIKKLLFLGSSCLYPRLAAQPISESELLTGALEPSNEYYAIAKIAGIKLCQAYKLDFGCNFITVMPPNLYGPNDHYDLENGHVLPALIRKIHEAKKHGRPTLSLWGSGKPKREFLHVDDLSEALLTLMLQYDELSPINIGANADISIRQLAKLIKDIIGYRGQIKFDVTKPDGTPRKLMDSSRAIQLINWKPSISLENGIRELYGSLEAEEWYE
jgi:GDP-L-fucose synthase